MLSVKIIPIILVGLFSCNKETIEAIVPTTSTLAATNTAFIDNEL